MCLIALLSGPHDAMKRARSDTHTLRACVVAAVEHSDSNRIATINWLRSDCGNWLLRIYIRGEGLRIPRSRAVPTASHWAFGNATPLRSNNYCVCIYICMLCTCFRVSEIRVWADGTTVRDYYCRCAREKCVWINDGAGVCRDSRVIGLLRRSSLIKGGKCCCWAAGDMCVYTWRCEMYDNNVIFILVKCVNYVSVYAVSHKIEKKPYDRMFF